MTEVLAVILLAAAGAVSGSFVSTAALRTAAGEEVLGGRSHCDGCARTLSWVETVPLVSYAAGAGRCRVCRSRIHLAHPLSEAAGAMIAVLVGAATPWSVALWMTVMGAVLAAAALIDLRTQRLPNALTAVVAICAAGLAAQRGEAQVLSGLVAAAVAVIILILVRAAFSKLRGDPSLGVGDVKLIAALALWLGALTPFMVALAALAGLLVQAAFRKRSERIAFGPMLAASGWGIGLLMEAGLWPA
jgi:leader peptidase (prepilin peptidase)/N-methyltransferase